MSKEAENHTFFLDSCPEWSLPLLGFLYERKQKIEASWTDEKSREVVSGHKNWDITNSCRRFSQDAGYQYSFDEFIATLTPNFETFTDEYSLGAPIKTYQFSILENDAGEAVGTSGVDNAYKEDTAEQAKHFQDEKLAKVGKRQQRAALETVNCQRLDQWIAQVFRRSDIPVGSKLMWFSPPGHLIEGYHGVSKKHHSFIWVYEKKNDGERNFVEMTQFRCWPSIAQIQSIQNQFSQERVETGALSSLESTSQFTERNQVIANMIELPASFSMDQIQETIYANEKKWSVQRSQMPDEKLSELTKETFRQQRQTILQNFLIPIYKDVIGPAEVQELLRSKLNDPFWTSDRYRHIVAVLDVAFAIAKQGLDKWVETSIESKHTATRIPIDDLQKLFLLRVKHMTTGLNAQENLTFNQLAPALLSAGNRLLSVGMCGIGTLIPLNLISKLNLGSLSANTSVGRMGSGEVSQLNSAERQQFRDDVLGMYEPLEVTRKNGQTVLFWIRKEYYEDYKGHCYEDENGVIKGPCDQSMESGEDEFVLTDEKYQELLSASKKDDTEAELKKLETEEALRLANAKSAAERDAIRSHYGKLKDRLKHKVTFTELLNGDVYVRSYLRAA